MDWKWVVLAILTFFAGWAGKMIWDSVFGPHLEMRVEKDWLDGDGDLWITVRNQRGATASRVTCKATISGEDGPPVPGGQPLKLRMSHRGNEEYETVDQIVAGDHVSIRAVQKESRPEGQIVRFFHA